MFAQITLVASGDVLMMKICKLKVLFCLVFFNKNVKFENKEALIIGKKVVILFMTQLYII